MAIRNIVTVPDPILRKKSREVSKFDERLFTQLDDMKDTLIESDGAGLAGPQVALLKRVALVMVEDLFLEMINPIITKSSGKQDGYEGCLSVPGKSGTVVRPNVVTVEYTDRFEIKHKTTVKGFAARAVCHELDHLDGVLYTDKCNNVESDEEL